MSRFSDDFALLQSAKSALEAQLADIEGQGSDSGHKIRQLEKDKASMQATIKELEKRRD